jgi:hypothetical protein
VSSVPTRGVVSSGSWFLLSSDEVPQLAADRAANSPDRGHLYCPVPAAGPWLDVDDVLSGDWPATCLSADGRLFTSVMCPSSIYSVSLQRSWILSSNVFLLGAVLGDRTQRLQRSAMTTIDGDGKTAFGEVRRVPSFSEHFPGEYTDPIANDPIEQACKPTVRDSHLAGTRLLDALRTSVVAIASADDAPPAVLLSGGVDSAALAWTANDLGLSPSAYSIGTAWGNEHEDAAELASYCGISHRRIDLSTDDLLDAIRPSILQLGHSAPEAVDSVLSMVAALRTGQIEERTVLTGWGSDLLNAGLLEHPSSPEEITRSLLTGMRRTQLSSEFSGLAAGSCGYRLCHPYWHKAVVEASLAVDPSCKYGPREKQHLRTAMAHKVPASVAWRKKLALHHGTGLEHGLSYHFGSARKKQIAYAEIFEDLASSSIPQLLAELGVRELLVEAPAVADGLGGTHQWRP